MSIDMKSTPDRTSIRTGRILQGVLALLLGIGALNNLLKTPAALHNAALLGYHEATLVPLALVLLLGVALYVFPRTAIPGALVLTAWLGGAVATHVIHGDGPEVLALPVLFGCLIWTALWLQDAALRSLVPVRY